MAGYPQIRHNALRKSIAGLSYDWVLWSVAGAALKVLHISLLRWNRLARVQYAARFPIEPVPSTVAVVNGGPAPHLPGASGLELCLYLHSFILSLIIGGQLWGYRLTQIMVQGISLWVYVFASLVAGFGLLILGCIATGRFYMVWLDFVYYVYLVGELAEALKYVPQISVNFMCRSTAGVSAASLIIESTGSGAVLGWMLLHGTAQPNSLLVVSIAKLVWFSCLLYQHFAVYRHQRIRSKRKYEVSSDVELSTL